MVMVIQVLTALPGSGDCVEDMKGQTVVPHFVFDRPWLWSLAGVFGRFADDIGF